MENNDNSMAENVAVRILGVKKMYRLGQIGGGTLQRDIQSWWARIRHKEDPNSKIGEKRLVGQTFMALNGIDLTIHRGEAIGIIGSNGAGKSTLLKLLSRVTAPTEGEIDIYGRITSMLEVGTGFNGEMTGRENIYMNGAILGMTKEEIDAKMEEIIEFSEVRDFIDTPVKRYSSGMYVKLAFSVAAHLDSEIMIMDEVLAVGDMAFQKKCLDKMRQAAKQQGRTVLYVSHNMNTIRQLCDRCVVLDQGKVVYDGEVEKGIAMYSGVVDSDFPVCYELKHAPRPSRQHGVDVVIQNLSFCNHEGHAIFKRTKPIDFNMTFECKKDFSELKVYFILKSKDLNVVGMAQSLDAIHNCKQGIHHCSFSFDCSNLVEGDYLFNIDLFTFDGFGKHLSVDHPMRIIQFRLIEDAPIGLDWQPQYFGRIRLNPIQITKDCDA